MPIIIRNRKIPSRDNIHTNKYIGSSKYPFTHIYANKSNLVW